MVPLGLGQAILGGWRDGDYLYGYHNELGPQSKIYYLTCSFRICMISMSSKELSISRDNFVAIPIPDSMSGCISRSKL